MNGVLSFLAIGLPILVVVFGVGYVVGRTRKWGGR